MKYNGRADRSCSRHLEGQVVLAMSRRNYVCQLLRVEFHQSK